jgi:hypothetical protein
LDANLIGIIVLAVAVLAAVATIVGKSRGPAGRGDLGTVSPHWLAERRLSQPQDSDR